MKIEILFEGLEEIVELIIEKGADVNAMNIYNETPLSLAISSSIIFKCNLITIKNHKMIGSNLFADLEKSAEILIQKGADIHVKTKQGNSILMLASSAGKTETLHSIIKSK